MAAPAAVSRPSPGTHTRPYAVWRTRVQAAGRHTLAHRVSGWVGMAPVGMVAGTATSIENLDLRLVRYTVHARAVIGSWMAVPPKSVVCENQPN